MSRGEFVYTAIWDDPKFEALSLEAGMLYFWSFTSRHCNMAGLYEIGMSKMAESKVPKGKLTRALEELADQHMVYYHESVLWVRSRVRRLHTKGRNIARAIARDVDHINAAHPMRVAFLTEYADVEWLSEQLEPLNIGPEAARERLALEREIRKTLPRVLEDPSKTTSALHVQCIEEPPAVVAPRDDVEALCSLLADLIVKNGSPRPTVTQRWRNECRLMLDRDGRTQQQVEAVIRWCQADTFWKANVLSMPKLRQQFDRLRLKMEAATGSGAVVKDFSKYNLRVQSG